MQCQGYLVIKNFIEIRLSNERIEVNIHKACIKVEQMVFNYDFNEKMVDLII
jgi:hypothetical protein